MLFINQPCILYPGLLVGCNGGLQLDGTLLLVLVAEGNQEVLLPPLLLHVSYETRDQR